MKAPDIDRILGVETQCVSLGDLLARTKGPGRATWKDLPNCPGIYAVCLGNWNTRSFAVGTGEARYVVSADPNLLYDKHHRILAAAPTDILYIGKAGAKKSNLRKRVSRLARFGVGRADNHKGGEWLWQVQGIDDAKLRM